MSRRKRLKLLHYLALLLRDLLGIPIAQPPPGFGDLAIADLFGRSVA
jgi:hypothetical protein